MCPVGKSAGAIRRGGNRADGHASRREASGRDSAGATAPMGMRPVGKSERSRFGGGANRFGIGQVSADGHVSRREERAVAIRRGEPRRWACVPSGRARSRFGGRQPCRWACVPSGRASRRDSAGGKPVRDRAGVRRWACVPSGRASGRDSAGETRRWACVPSGSEQAYFRAPWRFSSAARMTSSG